ncbi:MAG: hypothetical protein ACK559_22955, partial [bacterium]
MRSGRAQRCLPRGAGCAAQLVDRGPAVAGEVFERERGPCGLADEGHVSQVAGGRGGQAPLQHAAQQVFERGVHEDDGGAQQVGVRVVRGAVGGGHAGVHVDQVLHPGEVSFEAALDLCLHRGLTRLGVS